MNKVKNRSLYSEYKRNCSHFIPKHIFTNFKTKIPSIKTNTPILGSRYYHIFNRGVNRQSIFFQDKNYDYFLKLLNKFLNEYVHFLAYSLLPNHFHLILKIKNEICVKKRTVPSISTKKGTVLLPHVIKEENEIGNIVTKQLKRLFITYSMAINKQENRVGNLFDPKYKRLEITEQEYLEYAIFYTHFNPEKHGITQDYRNYKYSSYNALIKDAKTKIARNFVHSLFGGKEDFIKYHNGWHIEKETFILELRIREPTFPLHALF